MIYKEIELKDYEACQGGLVTFNEIKKRNGLEDFECLIEEVFPNGVEDMQLNDFLWFDRDYIYESLGYTDLLD